ncbi:IpaD/SipD/SspD family type III secretion system needle tip protein [Proteus terrae]|uniref:IpaD/SipD/SspD family type III secretion system needle tip protein n=1 Tax=Proteus terrae TaxID=1574161 RepID=UPI00298D01AD|nr:IpaD/SipD/SspD family type III secretion system needle tip protein [Proteus terrae]WPC98703.1 IpaD/SipD/SspD family type III secretion system needle tip protein [Proteus terrae]
MATAIDSNISKVSNVTNLENDFYNEITNDDFYDGVDYLLENIKREYQDIYRNKYQINKKLKDISNNEMVFYLDEQYVKNSIGEQKSLNVISHVARSIANTLPDDSYPTDSLSDLFDDIKQSIVAGKNDYLDVLKDIFSKYMEYVKELREILSELSKATSAGNKDGYISVDVDDLINKLIALKTKVDRPGFFSIWMYFIKDDDGRYYRIINGEKVYYPDNFDADNAVKAVEKLLDQIKGVTSKKEDNSDSVRPDLSFLFNVSLDLSGLDKLIDYLSKMPTGKHDILQTEFDLLKKTLDAIEKGLNTNLDELSKKYSSANSNYDNFVKIVSSTMNTLLEMAKGFLRF